MENILLKYLTEGRISDYNKVRKDTGPVITMSRDFGCEATCIADLLVESLNKKAILKRNIPVWKTINKEIIERSAQELHSNPHLISHIFDAEKRGFYAEIISSFSGKHYHSDTQIIRAISKVIREFAEEGHAVIVGRGAFAFTKHISKSLHIKLTAPFLWRVNNVARKHNISIDEAKVLVADLDEKRKGFLQLFNTSERDCEDFDLTINRKDLSHKEVVDLIINLMDIKKVF